MESTSIGHTTTEEIRVDYAVNCICSFHDRNSHVILRCCRGNVPFLGRSSYVLPSTIITWSSLYPLLPSQVDPHHHSPFISYPAKMKSTFYLAATCLVGFTNAGVHTVKLQKIPLAEQLVCQTTSHTWSISCLSHMIAILVYLCFQRGLPFEKTWVFVVAKS